MAPPGTVYLVGVEGGPNRELDAFAAAVGAALGAAVRRAETWRTLTPGAVGFLLLSTEPTVGPALEALAAAWGGDRLKRTLPLGGVLSEATAALETYGCPAAIEMRAYAAWVAGLPDFRGQSGLVCPTRQADALRLPVALSLQDLVMLAAPPPLPVQTARIIGAAA